MKRAAILYFTERGEATARKIGMAISADYELSFHRPRGGERPVVEPLFPVVDALIFVGACGIAVRAIAPFVRSKLTDPGVIVVDEMGLQAISLLSGHIGGANELTRRIAAQIGAIPVITTATDIHQRFTADEWAKKNGLAIASMQAAKRFAAEILRRDLPLYSDFPIAGKLPGGLFPGENGSCGLVISCRKRDVFEDALCLIPRKLHLGIGCKRGTPMEKIRAAVLKTLEENGIYMKALADAASIDVKKDEAGLLQFCEAWKLPVYFYSAGELMGAEGAFSASEFVKNTVGVDNVCERAAMLSAGKNGKLIVRKSCMDGVTVAVSQEDWSVCFE